LKVLAFSTTSFHFPRSWTQAIQFLIFIWQMSCLMLSSHLHLGLPCDLLVRGFQLNIFLTVLVSGIFCTWPNQLSLWALMWLIIFLCFISLSNCSLVLPLHIWFYFVGQNILLKIFLSKTNSFWIMVPSIPMFLRHKSLLVLLQFYIILVSTAWSTFCFWKTLGLHSMPLYQERSSHWFLLRLSYSHL
jgi:hypothetical protein